MDFFIVLVCKLSLKTKLRHNSVSSWTELKIKRFPIKSQTCPSLPGNVDFGQATVSFFDPKTNGYNTMNWKKNTIKWKVIFLMQTKI